MLKKTSITNIQMLQKNAYKLWEYNEAWLEARKALFTSSEIFKIMGVKGIGDTGLTYIYERVTESVTGKRLDSNVDNDAIRHGIMYEPEAIQKFMQINKISEGFVRVRTFIHEPGSMFGGTPDWIHILRESIDGTAYEVRGGEAKCPPKGFVSLSQCNTAMDLRDENRSYYVQCLDQMQNLGTMEHDFVAFHPDFSGPLMPHIRIIANEPFIVKGKKTHPVNDDLKLLTARKSEAVEIFNRVKNDLITKGYA